MKSDDGHFHDERCETSVRNGHVSMGSNGEVAVTNGNFTIPIVEMPYATRGFRLLNDCEVFLKESGKLSHAVICYHRFSLCVSPRTPNGVIASQG